MVTDYAYVKWRAKPSRLSALLVRDFIFTFELEVNTFAQFKVFAFVVPTRFSCAS